MTTLKISNIKPEYEDDLGAYSASLTIAAQSSLIPKGETEEAHELAKEQCRMLLRNMLWGPLVRPIDRLRRIALYAESGRVNEIMKEIAKATDGFIDL